MRCARRSIEWPAPSMAATSLRTIAVSLTSRVGRGCTATARAVAPHDRGRGAVALDPALVQAVADGAARRQRAVEVDAALGLIAAEGLADGARRLEDDERIDGAARAGAHGGGERRLGLPVLAEPRQRARLGAQQRRPHRLELPPRQLRVGVVGNLDDGLPFLEALEVGAAGDLVREVVPGARRENVLVA